MTVFLPKTTFPPRRSGDTDAAILAQQDYSNRKVSRVLDGPPYANGNLHIGHALNKILKDFVVRSEGDTAQRDGWDCHGLPIEWRVEEQYRTKNLDKNSVPVNEFRAECRAFAQHWVDVQQTEFMQLGIAADAGKRYLTMSPENELKIVEQLHETVRNGRVYAALKPVLWSPIEKTALASAETVDREHVIPACYVMFPIVEGPLMGCSALVWTTTPWSLPGNHALAINSQIEYAVYRSMLGEMVILSKTLSGNFPELDFMRDVAFWEFCHSEACNPLPGFDTVVPFLDAQYVRDTTGTGIVHVGPANSVEDWQLYRKNFPNGKIPDLLDAAGRFYDDIPVVGGLLVTKGKKLGPANDAVIGALGEHLYRREEFTMTLQHSWRSDAVLITNATRQVFIKVSDIDVEANLAEVEFVPETGRKRFLAINASRPDWLISRQRVWGTPLALFVDALGDIVTDESVLLKTREVLAERGMDAWWDLPAGDFLPEHMRDMGFEKVPDVLDVWYDSACAPIFEHNNVSDNTVIEGSDQHRGWFSSLFFAALAAGRPVPFDTVLTHGFVMDRNKAKMSKSQGNVLTPQKITDQYGADVLRVWVAMSDTTRDIEISPEAMKAADEIYRKLRGTMKYLLGALDGYVSMAVDFDYTDEIDNYILMQLQELDETCEKSLSEFNFTRFMTALHRFCVSDLSQFYFDVRKDRLYCDALDDPKRRACLAVFQSILFVLHRHLSVVTPLMMTEIGDIKPLDYRPNVERDNIVEQLFPVRETVFKALEEARRNGIIKGNGDAVVTLPDVMPDYMADFLVVSAVKQGNFADVAHAATLGWDKCERCWKYVPAVESAMCPRCCTVEGNRND